MTEIDENLESPKSIENGLFILGNRGSGKTCFLCGMYEYGRAHQDGGLSVLPLDATTARYLEEAAKFRALGHWPPPTSGTISLRLAIKSTEGRGYSGRLELLDYTGEHLIDIIADPENSRYLEITKRLNESTGFIILLDPFSDIDIGQPLQCGREEMRSRQDILIKTIGKCLEQRANSGIQDGRINIMLVITKADLLGADDWNSIKHAISKYNGPFIKRIAAWTRNHKIRTTSISAFGSINSDGSPPENPEPMNYKSVLEIAEEWQWRHNNQHHLRLAWKLAAIAAIMILVAILGVLHVRSSTGNQIDAMPIDRVAEWVNKKWPSENDIPRHVLSRLNDRLEQQRLDISRQIDLPNQDRTSLRSLRERMRIVKDMPGNLNKDSDLKRLNEINQDIEERLWDEITAAVNDNDARERLCREYLAEFPRGLHVQEVREILRRVGERHMIASVDRIKSTVVGNRQQLRDKANMIKELLSVHRSELEARGIDAEQAQHAADIAFVLAGVENVYVRNIQVVLDGYGDRDQILKWLDGRVDIIPAMRGKDSTRLSFASPRPISIDSNRSITIRLDARHNYRWKYSTVAQGAYPLYHLLTLLDGKIFNIKPRAGWSDAKVSLSGQVTLREGNQHVPLTQSQLHALRYYILTDRGWRLQ